MIIIDAMNDVVKIAQTIPPQDADASQQNIPNQYPTESPPDFDQIELDDSGETNIPDSFETDSDSIQKAQDDTEEENDDEQESEGFDQYQEAELVSSKYDDANKNYSIDQKIDLSLLGDGSSQIPLEIKYVSLKGKTTKRVIIPQYIHSVKAIHAEGDHNILVAWCRLVNNWRKFIINSPTAGIKEAKLLEEKSESDSSLNENNQKDGEKND